MIRRIYLSRILHHEFKALRRNLSIQSSYRDSEAFLWQETTPGITSLILNRPSRKNAISMRLLTEFRDCLDTIRQEATSVRTLIIRSVEPGAFCAGADLEERRTMTKSQVDNFLADLRAGLAALENLPIPTIAAIDGPALGGGLELGLACDLRVAGPDVTKIGLPESRLGIIPGAGGTQRTTRLLGVSKAKMLIYTGRMLSASEALDWGLVDHVADPPETAYDHALRLAKEIASSAPLALRAAKMAISRALDLPLESGLDFENACYRQLLTSKDREEALLAFKEKRKPVFRGE